MSFAGQVASIGLHTLAAAADMAGSEAAGKLALAVGYFLADRVGDGSRRLGDALALANRRAWAALEAALAGPSLARRLKAVAGRAEDRVFAGQLQTFLATVPLGDSHDTDESARRKALAELRHAQKAGLIDTGVGADALQAAAEPMARYTRREEMVEAQESALREVAAAMHRAGYVYLARVLAVRPDDGEPLLVVALGYFFRRAVEGDEALFRGLTLSHLKELRAGVESGFAALELALDLHADRVEALLAETRDGVLDLRDQLSGQGEQLRAIAEAVQQILEQHRLHRREVRPGDSLTLRGEGERVVVRQLVRRYHALPEGDRATSPALLGAVGKLEVIAGDFADARRDFGAAAALAGDRGSRAEAHFNAYRAALEERDLEGAMSFLRAALADDARRFSPVPLETYEPERILGAGGFGVAILCRHRYMKAHAVVKALWLEPLGIAADGVFTEAHLLRQIDHPGIIRITDCGYVDPAASERPYVVMDYFVGDTLEQHLRANKTLPLVDYLAVARQVAEALAAAHAEGILHRDVKPANVLARRDGERWRVKLIDFGLAMRHRVPDDRTTTRAAKTLLGESIAGTLSYAAPEQLRGETVGPTADVYAFARTSCRMLFGTTDPLPRHWQGIPEGLAALLGECLEEAPADRPADFAAVLARLDPAPSGMVFAPMRRMEPMRPMEPMAPMTPLVVTDAPNTEPFDVEAYTSALELVRLMRRQLRMGLFRLVSWWSYPFVTRSEGGGYELSAGKAGGGEKVHPARELRRLIGEQERLRHAPDERLRTQLTETIAEARTRLAAAPPTIVWLGGLALVCVALCPFCGFLATLMKHGPASSGGEPAGFIVAIVFTGITGEGIFWLGVLALVALGQRRRVKALGREVVAQLEPLLTGRSAKPVMTWPSGRAWRRVWTLVGVSVFVFAASLTALIVSAASR